MRIVLPDGIAGEIIGVNGDVLAVPEVAVDSLAIGSRGGGSHAAAGVRADRRRLPVAYGGRMA